MNFENEKYFLKINYICFFYENQFKPIKKID